VNVGRTSLVLIALVVGGCTVAERPYQEEIEAWRAQKDAFMRSDESPVPPEGRATFPPLSYFPIDERFRVPAVLKVSRGDETMEMSTSTGTRRTMRRIGTLEFTLEGTPMTLTAFAEATDTTLLRLFVPFGDATNRSETYRAGRYLDLDRTATGLYDLDFNHAYHPFCLFNTSYECPIPPRENQLKVFVRAGERLPQ
jgi:uncharacterized protein (DUF1684 family)